MAKPNGFSVTDQPCTCSYLEHQADQPESPITFDPELNEYNFEYPESGCEEGCSKASLRIYHCPMCGGAAPESKRRSFTDVIPHDEQERLRAILHSIGNAEEAIQILGPPDEDDPVGSADSYPDAEGRLTRIQYFRTMRYRNLSETAEVQIGFSHTGIAYFSLAAKRPLPPGNDSSER